MVTIGPRLDRRGVDAGQCGSAQKLLVVAGEPSGDRAAARAVAILAQSHRIAAFGIGGDHLSRAGVDIIAHIHGLTALGMGETARRLGSWMRAWAGLREEVAKRQPRAALLVDTPEVNLPLARVLSQAGIRVVLYIGPQVWAWRPGRLNLLRDRVDVTALVLPFEQEIYDTAGIDAVFVGHPVLDEPPAAARAMVRSELGLGDSDRLVALLPGSRRQEVARHAGPMIDAASRLGKEGVFAVFTPAPNAAADPVLRVARHKGCLAAPADLSARDLLGAADAALVASGSATLEAAVAGTPMAVIYKVDPVSRIVARLLIHVPYIGLPSWIAGRPIVPELLQEQVRGSTLANQALALLDPREQERQKKELSLVVEALGDPGAAKRVADLVSERLR